MAVIKCEKKKNYTVMSNRHLRDTELSCKACGLLSKMLSLPKDWDFTIRGLTAICKDGECAVRSALKELEDRGYLVRVTVRREGGQITDVEYRIFEEPSDENPHEVNPQRENLHEDIPHEENCTQLNKEKSNTEKENKNKIKNESIPSYQVSQQDEDTMRCDSKTQKDILRERIRENISFEELCEEDPENRTQYEETAELILDVASSKKRITRISGNDYGTDEVRQRFLMLNADHIRYVFTCMKETSTQIRNIRQYLLAALFNAPTTIESYYAARVNYELNDSQYEPDAAVYGSEWDKILA